MIEEDGKSTPGDASRVTYPVVRRDFVRSSEAALRIIELDSLRGLAALAVVVFHAHARWFCWGWAAVDLFFVLSGYLITGIILRHGDGPGFLASFYARRALRIWPIYYFSIGLVAALTPWLVHKPEWSVLGFSLTFTQGIPEYWTGRPAMGFSRYLGHTWTLAIEEQFYLIWPALVLAVGRSRVIPLALAVTALSVVVRCSGWNPILLLARADGLGLGALLAGMEARAGHDPRRRSGIAIASLAALLLGGTTIASLGGFTFLRQVPRLGPTIFAYNVMFFGAVGIAVTGAGRPSLAWLRRRPLMWLGTISYGLYVIHQILFQILGDVAHAHGISGRPVWLFLPAILASLLLASLTYRWIEEPILGWKSRFPYGRTTEGDGTSRAVERSRRLPSAAPGIVTCR